MLNWFERWYLVLFISIVVSPLLGWLGIIVFSYLNRFTNEYLSFDFFKAFGLGLILTSFLWGILILTSGGENLKVKGAILGGIWTCLLGVSFIIASEFI